MGVILFLVKKLINTQCGGGRWARKTPIMKESSKKFTEAEHSLSQQHQLVYTDTDGFLEHSPKGGRLYYKGSTLQKIILVVLGGCPPLYSFSCSFIELSQPIICWLIKLFKNQLYADHYARY